MKRHPGAVAGLAILIAIPCSALGQLATLRNAVGVQSSFAAQIGRVAQAPAATQVVPQPAAPPAPETVTVVTPDARQQLLQAIASLSTSSAGSAQRANSIVLAFVLATLVLGVLASIAGFLKAAVPAGILSILATAAVGANNALPFRDQANTFSYVSAESSALLTQAQLDAQMTEQQYEHYKYQLTKLATYGDNSAASGSTQDLANFLQALHAGPPS